jgi:hypothetical protein
MSTGDPLSFLKFLRGEFKREGLTGRLNDYRRPDFDDQLLSIGRALREAGVERDLIQNLMNFGAEMRTKSLNGEVVTAESQDSFYVYFEGLVSRLVAKEGVGIVQKVMSQIDSDFAEPVRGLVEALPKNLAQSKERLISAVKSFQEGRKEESALFTRQAWEACVNFGLSKLPRTRGTDSLTKKTEYILNSLAMRDKSKSINHVKNLFEGRFLHVIDSNEKVPDPELPFYIALATGFVRLVASYLAS